jgi:hypothetical protein
VSARSDLSFDKYVRLDQFYIENLSLAFDVYLIAKTIPPSCGARRLDDGVPSGVEVSNSFTRGHRRQWLFTLPSDRDQMSLAHYLMDRRLA